MTKNERSMYWLLKRIIKHYPYNVDYCKNRPKGPCKQCKGILDAKALIEKMDKEK